MTGKNTQREFEAEDHDCRQIAVSHQADFPTAKVEPPPSIGPMGGCPVENIAPDVREESSTEETHSEEEDNRASAARGTQTSPCSSQVSQIARAQRKTSSNSAQRGEELHVLALSEAQMKVDIAAMQKEEAKCKLEEVRYRKEEAKLRMLFFTYKLDKLKDWIDH